MRTLFLIITIEIVPILCGSPQRCIDHCLNKKPSTDGAENILKLNCICPPEVLYNSGPTLSHSYFLDDSISYKPAEVRKTFFDETFYFRNPFRDSGNDILLREAMKLNPLVLDTKTYIDQTENTNAIHGSRKYRHDETISTETLLPQEEKLFLDVSLRKPSGKERSRQDGYARKNNPDITLDQLSKCLDFDLFQRTRYHANMTSLRQKWGSQKLSTFEKLSDAEVMTGVNSNCYLPAQIVNESVREIKETRPRKDVSHKLKEERSFEDKDLPDLSINSFKSDEITIPPSSTLKDIDNDFLNLTFSSNENETSVPVTEIFHSETSTIAFEGPEYTYHETLNENLIEGVNGNQRLNVEINTEETTTKTKDPKSQNTQPVDDEALLNENVDVNVIFTTTESSSSFLDKLSEFSNTKDKPWVQDQKRQQVEESEMIIPKIITTEFLDGRVISNIVGTESLPNDDFTDNTIDRTTIPYNIQSKAKSFGIDSEGSHSMLIDNIYSNNDLNNMTGKPESIDVLYDTATETMIQDVVSKEPAISYKSTKRPENEPDRTDISGKLYFSFGTRQVPARFVQESDGRLNIEIDGKAACEIIDDKQSSVLLQRLCKVNKMLK